MRVLVLGSFEVRGDDDRPVEVVGVKVRALVARLAMEPGRVVSADALTEAIWGDRPPANGANALQALASRVRRVIGSARLEGRPPGYRLVVDDGDVDAVRFEQLVAVGRQASGSDPAQALTMLREAEALWRGPAWGDLLELQFAADAATRLDQLRLAATEDRLAIEIAAGNDILDELRPLADAHPLAERLQGLRIRALYAAGRQAEALQAYDRTRDHLADELGIDPSAELTDLHLAILRQAADLPTRRRRTNLRAQVTSFVGREDDLAGLTATLTTARLVTVVGPGGAGKTRLAVEAAEQADAPGGIWLVELAAVTDPVEVATAVLTAIGVREVGLLDQPAGDATARLVEFFTHQRALLILDNCEHLIEAVAELADRLLGACPQLRILATSREPLAIGGENLHPLAALPWPADSMDDPAEYPAVRLFVERARAVRPGFAIDEANSGAVVEICRRLDGIALAIELAAARMRALSVQQIAAKLDDRFALLGSGSRTAPARHRTLRGVIEWSWALLSPAERELAMRLAIFPSGASLDAVDDIDVLTDLVDKSLVERAGIRYRMLESIRSYALEQLAHDGRGPLLRDEHARYFLRLVEAADLQLRGADQLTALALLDAERENIMTALRFAVESADIDLGVRLLGSMFWYWGLRGIQTERLQWTRAVLDIPGVTDILTSAEEPHSPVPDTHRAVLFVLDGLMQYETGSAEVGARAVARGIELGRRAGGSAGAPGQTVLLVAPTFLEGGAGARAVADSLRELSGWERAMTLLLTTMAAPANADLVFDQLAEARREFEMLGERFGLASALRMLAAHRLRRGDSARGIAELTQAAEVMEELGIVGDCAEIRAELGVALVRAGELDRAHVALRESRHHAAAAGEPRTLAYVRMAEAEYEIHRGHSALALRELDRAEAGFAGAALGARARMVCAGLRALVAVQAGDTATARRTLDRAVAACADTAQPEDLAIVTHMYAAIAVHDGAPGRAAYLIGLGAALIGIEDRRGYDNPLRPADRARELLDAEEFAQAYNRGSALTRDAATRVLCADPLATSA
ncbi:BTAD domain-containing putative transcriptional regulator [Nocardia sp. NBC_00403]|uniref:BTAD domain-containing putative transcriptional regulator n=1 Tax=Nocardia sp. NBC_00403 TaxID=2975990 RepID=UPI002E233086